MNWLSMSAAWHRSRYRSYRFVKPTLSAVVMFLVAMAIHIAFNLVNALVAGL